MILKLDMQHKKIKLNKVCINDDPGLTLPIYGTVKFGNLGFSIEERENCGVFT